MLYGLGKIDKEEFKYPDLEDIVRKEFPDSTKDLPNFSSSISKFLSELSQEDPKILKKINDSYCFLDPKYKVCIRAMLVKKDNISVVKKDLEQIRQ